MCCRYWADESPEIREIVEEMNGSPLVSKWQKTAGITTFGEVRPTNVVPVIVSNRSGERSVFPMKWGFTGRTLLVNARTETASTKATFKNAWASHRCIVPASWYFEWEHIILNDGRKKTGQKYLLQPKGSTMTWLCGLYRIEEGLLINPWIHPDTRPEELLGEALTDMVYEKVGDKPVQMSML